jgi:hypothetical protein
MCSWPAPLMTVRGTRFEDTRFVKGDGGMTDDVTHFS